MQEITSEAELRELLGHPLPQVATKERPALDSNDRMFLAAAPFCLVATSDAEGRCDVLPKGDPPGFTVDESAEELGSKLQLPPWLEPARYELTAILPPIRLPAQQVRQ